MSFPSLELVSQRQVCFHFPVWDVLLPVDTRLKGPTAFCVSSERHRQSGVNEIAFIQF